MLHPRLAPQHRNTPAQGIEQRAAALPGKAYLTAEHARQRLGGRRLRFQQYAVHRFVRDGVPLGIDTGGNIAAVTVSEKGIANLSGGVGIDLRDA